MQAFGPVCASLHHYAALRQGRWTAAQENGSEQQLELGRDAFSHPLSSNSFSNGLYITDALKEHDEKVSIRSRILPICGLLMT